MARPLHSDVELAPASGSLTHVGAAAEQRPSAVIAPWATVSRPPGVVPPARTEYVRVRCWRLSHRRSSVKFHTRVVVHPRRKPMTQRVVFAVAAAVVLNAVLSANSAQAARPTLDVADKGDDVRVLPFNSPYTTITRAERLSIDVKRLTVTPRADGTVHFAVEVGEILRSKRFFQQIDVVFRRKTTSRPGWAVAGVGWTPGGWKPGARRRMRTWIWRLWDRRTSISVVASCRTYERLRTRPHSLRTFLTVVSQPETPRCGYLRRPATGKSSTATRLARTTSQEMC